MPFRKKKLKILKILKIYTRHNYKIIELGIIMVISGDILISRIPYKGAKQK